MKPIIQFFHRHRLRASMLVVLLATIAGGFFAVTRAQGEVQARECRNLLKIEACADLVIDHGGGNFTMVGDIFLRKLGDENPLILVARNEDDAFAPAADYDSVGQEGRLEYTRLASGKNEIALYGDIRFLLDPNTKRTLIRTYHLPAVDDFARPRVLLDEELEMIYIPDEQEWKDYYKQKYNKDVPRMAGITLPMLDSFGLGWYPDVLQQDDLNGINLYIPFALRELELGLPLAEMPLIDIEGKPGPMSADFTVILKEDGTFRTRVDQQKIKIAGFTATIKGAQLLDLPATRANATGNLLSDSATLDQAATNKGIQFDAIEIRKEDNPDLPNLDPSDPNVVFKLENLIYHEGRFSIKAGTKLKDWQLGNAFRLTDQGISVSLNQLTNRFEFTIDSTLTFGGANAAVRDGTRYPIRLSIAAEEVNGELQPIVRGTLGTSQPNLGLGLLQIKPQNVGLEFNAADNFYGLVAQQVTIQWSSHVGGSSSPTLSGFRLGIDRDKNLRFNLGAGGEIDFPEFRTSVLRGRLRGSISAENNVLTAALGGTLNIALPGNSGAAPTAKLTLRAGEGVSTSCAANNSDCLLNYEMDLSALDLKLAGFTVAIADPSGLNGGGIRAEKALLKTPSGLSFLSGAGLEIRGLVITGGGSISIAGGGISLPTIRAGGYEFTGGKGFFAKTTGGYEFRAAATMPLPGVSASSSRKLDVDLAFRTRPDGSFLGAGVKIDFNSNKNGIPIGSTGMELTRVVGSFDTGNGSTKISVTMRAVSTKQIRGIPIATIDGSAQLQFKPFQLTANAKLSLLVVEVARASIGIGAGQGFNGGDGFYAQVNLDFKVARGEFLVRMGKLTLSNGYTRMSVAIKAHIDVSIPKHYFYKYVPPFSIDVAQLTIKGGDFKVKGEGEALGVLGSASCCWGWLTANYFVDLRTGSVRSVEPDDYDLIDSLTLRTRAAQGIPGYTSQQMRVEALAFARGLDVATVQSWLAADGDTLAAAGTLLSETVPVTLTHAGSALFGISYPSGNPRIAVAGPNGLYLQESTISETDESVFFKAEPSPDGGMDRFIAIRNAPAGNYTLIIDNAPATYDNISYVLNTPPSLSNVSFNCGKFDSSSFVNTECNGAPSGDGVSINFQAADRDSPDAKIYVGYVPVIDGVDDDASRKIVMENISLAATETGISTEGIPSGTYRMFVGINDGANPPVEVSAKFTVNIGDQQAPAADRYAFIETQGAPRAVLVRWSPEDWPAADVAGYEVAVGPLGSDEDAEFTYIRNAGNLGLDDLDNNDMFNATIWGLPDQAILTVAVRAYDYDGNRSEWVTNTVETWTLAPNGQSPLPGGQALPTSSAQLLFDTPMVAETLNQHLELTDSDGNKVAGTPTFLIDGETGLVYGMRFTPSAPLTIGAMYQVMMVGGTDGVRAEDGRSMPDDYGWTFSVVDPANAESALIVPEPASAEAPPEESGIPGELPQPGNTIYLPLLQR